MKVGVIGSGVVGQTLAAGFVKHGHEVEIGTRDPAKLKDWSTKNPGVGVRPFADAAAFGDVLVLAVGGEVAQQALALIGPDTLDGKTVIDACNPIGGGPPVNGVLRFFTPQNDSLMEQLQKTYPFAHFVKAFNSVGSAQMVNPEFAGGRPTMFICGNDADAKAQLRKFSISSVGTLRIWARSRRRGRSRRFACCGAFLASDTTIGRRTRSSFSVEKAGRHS
jgi:8-hydroxy-5-deazaflavin:NADPH oxidoreductase